MSIPIRPDFGLAVAEMPLVLVFPGEKDRSVVLRVGCPYLDGSSTWACPCELVGYENRHPDVRGAGPLQALCLALSFLRLRLDDFVQKGGAILDPASRTSLPLAPFFGGIGVDLSDLSRNSVATATDSTDPSEGATDDSGEDSSMPDGQATRGNAGVVSSLFSQPDDKVLLVMDEVEQCGTNPKRWAHVCLFSNLQLEKEAVTDSTMSEAALAEIGFNLMARLAAGMERP